MPFVQKREKARGVRRVVGFSTAAAGQRRAALARAAEVCIEQLESRQLLSVNAIGINLTGGNNPGGTTTPPMAASDVAGVIPIANYNNEDTAPGATTGMDTSLHDSTGAVTTATLNYSTGGPWSSIGLGGTPPFAPVGGDQELNLGFIYGDTDAMLGNIPYTNYDVYVYELNDGTRGQQTTDVNSGVTLYLQSPNPADANHESGVANTYQYVAGTSTDINNPTPNGDFVVFSDSSPTFEFKTHALTSNGFVTGIEIVDHTSTAPTLQTATGNNNSVGLTWTYGNSVTNNFTYSIYRTDAAHPTPTKIASGVQGQSYTDTTAVNGTAYTYFITADNSIGPSANSNSKTATPTSLAPPAVSGLQVSRTAPATVALTWNAALGATGYDVKRGTALNTDGTLGGTVTDLTPSGVTTTTFTDTNAPGSAYYYEVIASNGVGSAPASPAVLISNGDGWQASYYSSDQAGNVVYTGDQIANTPLPFTQPDGTPLPTTGPDATPPATPQTNNAVLGFQRNEASPIHYPNNNNTILPPNAPSNFNIIEGVGNQGADFSARWVGFVTPQMTGYYTLLPSSDDGAAVTVFDTTNLTNNQPTPVTLQPDDIYAARAVATDVDPVVDSKGQAVLWQAGHTYEVQMDYNNQGGGWEADLAWAASSTTANQTAGKYDVQPQVLIPTSQVSAPIPSFQTIDAANPSGLAKDSTYYTISTTSGPQSIQLQFSSIGADSYNIYRSTSSSGTFVKVGSAPGTTGVQVTFTDTGLTNGQTYFYTVTGVDLAGETPMAQGRTTSATPGAGPATPTNLTAVRKDANTVALTWNPVLFAATYDVRRGTALNADGTLGGTVVDLTSGGVAQAAFTDTNAFQRTTWYYEVTATNASGTSPASKAAVVQLTFSLAVPNAISVQFTGGNNPGGSTTTTPLGPGELAGVVPEANYNTEATAAGATTGTDTNLHDNTAAASGATLNYTTGGPWSSIPAPFTPATPDQKLNWGFIFGDSDVTIANIPYGNYDVYVYELNDGSRGQMTTDVINGAPDVSYFLTSPPPGDANHESGVANTYQYVQGTSTDMTNPTPNADYVLFANHTTATFEFVTHALTSNGFLNGFEIVDHPLAAPATAPTLNAPTIGNNSVSLSWNSVKDASSYTVYRTDTAHPTPSIVATNVTGTSYTDNTVTGGVTYTYTVTADDSVGASPMSNAVMAAPGGGGGQNTIGGTAGNDAITLKKDADGTDIDWTLNGGAVNKVAINDPKGLTINGNGGTDTITLDNSNGDPTPDLLVLNQTGAGSKFILIGLSQPSAGHKIDIENSTVQINYSGSSILPAVQTALAGGQIFSSTLASNPKFAIADTDSADPLNSGQAANTILLRPAILGNATLTGRVGFNDFVQLARNYGKNNADWAMGDFNYDAKVDFGDLVALARNYNQSGPAATAAALTPAVAADTGTLPKSRRPLSTRL